MKNRIQAVQTDKTTAEAKLAQQEKQTNELNTRLDAMKRDKVNKENTAKQSKQKIVDLEHFIEKLEATAESKIQTLSDATHQTLTIAQFRLKYAFKSVDNYERMIKYLYESLVKRCIDLRKEIKVEKVTSSETIKKSGEKLKTDGN